MKITNGVINEEVNIDRIDETGNVRLRSHDARILVVPIEWVSPVIDTSNLKMSDNFSINFFT